MSKRPGRKPTLVAQPQLQGEILELIELGAYDYQAAEASGISQRTFQRWMRWGQDEAERMEREDAGYPSEERACYYHFARAVEKARARARVQAEIRVQAEDPKFWLRSGPGRTRPGRPGWTETVSVVGGDGEGPVQSEELHVHTDEERAARAHEILDAARARRARRSAGADGADADDDRAE